MASDSVKQSLNEKINAAQLETLPAGVEDADDDTFMAIVRDIVKGSAGADEVEDRLLTWANEMVDIPLVPESLEREGLEVVSDLLVSAAMDAADQFLQ